MIKAVIFDFDGTLADSLFGICKGINLTMQQYGYEEHTEQEIPSFINHGAKELVRRAMPAHLQSDEALVDRVLADYQAHYANTCLYGLRAYAGIPELLSRLHNSYRIGVLSNKPHAHMRAVCDAVLPKGSYDHAQGTVAGKPTKPDPYLTELVAQALGVRPEECAMVGDSDVDIRTAANAGMRHIGVAWGYRSEEFLRAHGATRIAHTAEEIEVFLKD